MALASLGGAPGAISGAVREVATDPQGVISHRLREKKDMQVSDYMRMGTKPLHPLWDHFLKGEPIFKSRKH